MVSTVIEMDALLQREESDASTKWAELPEISLRYDHFLGDVLLVIDGVDLSARWGWVPVLDFALGFTELVGGLRPGATEVFEFTESEAHLRVSAVGDLVEVTASFASGRAQVDRAELRLSAMAFLRGLVTRISVEHAALSYNPHLALAVNRACSVFPG